MPASTVRSNFDELNNVAGAFSSNSDNIKTMTQDVNSKLEELRSGKWVGKGATKFYKEMDDHVMPSLQRLERALSQASSITKQISKLMKGAEDECSGLFKV